MVAGTAYSYVAVTTPQHLRTLRITIFDTLDALGMKFCFDIGLISLLAHLVGVIAYGELINQSPIWSAKQVHNYGLIFFVSSLSAFLALIWTLFFINQEKDIQLFKDYFCRNAVPNVMPEESDKHSTGERNVFSIRQIVNCKNVRQVMITCLKKRPKRGRAQIWLSMAGIFLYLFILMTVPAFEFQFYQKVYKWDAKDMSFWESIGLIANSVFVMISTPILIRVLYLNLTPDDNLKTF